MSVHVGASAALRVKYLAIDPLSVYGSKKFCSLDHWRGTVSRFSPEYHNVHFSSVISGTIRHSDHCSRATGICLRLFLWPYMQC